MQKSNWQCENVAIYNIFEDPNNLIIFNVIQPNDKHTQKKQGKRQKPKGTKLSTLFRFKLNSLKSYFLNDD